MDSPPPPERKKLGASPGGVDMRSGSLNLQNVDVSIGGDGDAGLALSRSFSYKDSSYKFRQPFGQFFTHNWDIQIQERRLPRAGDCYPSQFAYSETIVYGDLGDNFIKSGNVGTFEQTAPNGYAELTYSGAYNNPNGFVFTARDGTTVNFMTIGDGVCPGAVGRCGYAASVARPDGTLYTLDYETLADGIGKRLRSVVSNRGFALLFEYGGEADGFQQTTRVCAINLAVLPKPGNNVCPGGVATASYTYDGSVQTSATDATGGVWNFGRPSGTSFSLTRPGDAQPYSINNYSFVRGGNDEEPSFVIDSQQLVSGETYNYNWSILYNEDGQGSNSQQVLGGGWSDGVGRSVSVQFGSYYREAPQGGGLPTYYGTPGPEVLTDQLGRITRFNYCGSIADGGQCYIPPLQTVTDPEGNVEAFVYDGYRNVTQVTRKAKPNSGQSDLIEVRNFAYQYPTSRAKPTAVIDARNNETDYIYDPVHGGVLTETSPPDANGVRAVKRSTYAQRYAWLSNGGGGYVPASSPVWLLSSEKTCRTSATSGDGCTAGAGDEVATTYEYGPDSGPNNLLLRGVAVTADGQTRRTCYGYDPQGNRISETKPRAGLGVCP